MHFPMNCALYLHSKKLLVTLSQHRSGGALAAGQNTGKSSFGACAPANCACANVRGNAWQKCQISKSGSHQLSL